MIVHLPNVDTDLSQFLRWQLISIFDIGFELALVGMTIYLVWGLQTSMDNKLAVVFAFGTRLPYVYTLNSIHYFC